MKQHMKFLRFAPLVLISSGLFFYQNCGKLQPTELISQDFSSESIDTTTSLKLRQQHCASCHAGANASAEPKFILDDQKLIEDLWIKPGDPDGSPLYQALYANMPLGSNRLSDGDIRIFSDWIQGLGEDGSTPAHLQIDDQSLLDFGTVNTSSEKEVTLTIHNSGGRSAKSLTGSILAPFAFKGSGFPGTGGTCGSSLSAGDQCTLTIRYAPTASGSSNTDLTISYKDKEVPQTFKVTLHGTGIGGSRAQLSLRPTIAPAGLTPEEKAQAFPFANVVSGANTIRSFTVENSGAGPATQISITGLQSGFSVASQTCGTSLAAGASCVIEVKFAPTELGVKQGQMILNYNFGDGTASEIQGFIGSGTSLGSASSIFYSEIRTILSTSCGTCHTENFAEYPRLLNFKKTGFLPAIDPGNQNSRFIQRISESSEGHPRMGASPNWGNLADSDRLKVIAWINDGAPESDGRMAILQVTEGPVNFGSVVIGQSSEKTLTVTNTGNREATSLSASGLATPFAFKGGSFPGTGGTCTSTLSAAAQCTLVLTFSPSASGPKPGTVTITAFNGVSVQSLSRSLSGTGTVPTAAVLVINEGAQFDFAYIGVGKQSQVTLHIRNSGGTVAKLTSMTGLSAPMNFKNGNYTASGNCGASLAANAECNVVIEFKPVANAAINKTLKINYKSGNASAVKLTQIVLTGRGAGAQKVYFTELANQSTGPLFRCFACHDGMRTYNGIKGFKDASQTASALAGGLKSRFVDILLNPRLDSDGRVIQASMASKVNLTPAEIQQILDWIAQDTPNYEVGKISQNFKPLIGDRYYMSSMLFRVFGSKPDVASEMDSIISRADIFGSACFTQDLAQANKIRSFPVANDNCFIQNSNEVRLEASPSPLSSAISESMRMTACLRIVAKKTNILSALALAQIPPGSAFSTTHIQSAYTRFYPGGGISADTSAKLMAIGNKAMLPATGLNQASNPADKNLEGWRYIFMTLCLSPGWQAP